MDQVMKMCLSCYLVLLSFDSKIKQQDRHTFLTCPIYPWKDIPFQNKLITMVKKALEFWNDLSCGLPQFGSHQSNRLTFIMSHNDSQTSYIKVQRGILSWNFNLGSYSQHQNKYIIHKSFLISITFACYMAYCSLQKESLALFLYHLSDTTTIHWEHRKKETFHKLLHILIAESYFNLHEYHLCCLLNCFNFSSKFSNKIYTEDRLEWRITFHRKLGMYLVIHALISDKLYKKCKYLPVCAICHDILQGHPSASS